jgi:hypothetical protein
VIRFRANTARSAEFVLWHGTEDPKVPVELARRAASTLPRCEARFVPGGHLAACEHLYEIMKILAAGGTEKTPPPATPATKDADANKPRPGQDDDLDVTHP